MNGVNAKKVISYSLLPGIIPRCRNLFASGFGYIAFLMASIYNSVRLLPNGHPYLIPANIGKFGIRHVVAEAANNLVIKKENIDQLFVFALMLTAIVIMFMQIILLFYGYVIQPALATSVFVTANPETDIAFNLLDRVFGVPGVFCNTTACTELSGVAPPAGDWRWPFHIALHSIFQFYSTGLLLIAVLIFLYFVVVVVVETASSGTPFGQRFQSIWTPVRLIVALGLLIPINYGLNSGQYIGLYAAKMGSGFATNTWRVFNNTIETGTAGSIVFPGGEDHNPIGEKNSLLAKPIPPNIGQLVQAMSLIHACAYSYWKLDGDIPDLGPPTPAPFEDNWDGITDIHTQWNLTEVPPYGNDFYIKPYLVKHPRDWETNTDKMLPLEIDTPYATGADSALSFYNYGDIVIRFGKHDPVEYEKAKGNVAPLCGEIRIHISDLNYAGDTETGDGKGGADHIQNYYYDLVKILWFGETGESQKIIELSHRLAELKLDTEPRLACKIGCTPANPDLPACPDDCFKDIIDAEAKQKILWDYQGLLDAEVVSAWDIFNQEGLDIEIEDDVINRGWAGAGIWYNTISKINGSFVTAVRAVPSLQSYPQVMEEVRQEKKKNDSEPGGFLEQFNPRLSDGKPVDLGNADDLKIAKALNETFTYWNTDGTDPKAEENTVSQSIFENVMHAIFGTEGLFAMRGWNAHVHPLAQLSSLGKGLVDSAIFNIAVSSAAGFAGGPLSLLDNYFGVAAEIASSFLIKTAFIGLTAGFVLFYVLPFLPFVYFFFAVGSWLKTIFEAMVGIPLWALAHLRLDGEGLPGDSASNGYFLVFEIFLRPILTVFGLVASMLIFTAQIRALHMIWGLVIDNLGGFEGDPTMPIGFVEIDRSVIDEFFFTVVYAIIVYMMATASFKLIDKIPDNILRWMGAGVSSFGDINDDPTQGLTRYAALGGLTVGQQAAEGIRDAAAGAGQAFKGELNKFLNPRGTGPGG